VQQRVRVTGLRVSVSLHGPDAKPAVCRRQVIQQKVRIPAMEGVHSADVCGVCGIARNVLHFDLPDPVDLVDVEEAQIVRTVNPQDRVIPPHAAVIAGPYVRRDLGGQLRGHRHVRRQHLHAGAHQGIAVERVQLNRIPDLVQQKAIRPVISGTSRRARHPFPYPIQVHAARGSAWWPVGRRIGLRVERATPADEENNQGRADAKQPALHRQPPCGGYRRGACRRGSV